MQNTLARVFSTALTVFPLARRQRSASVLVTASERTDFTRSSLHTHAQPATPFTPTGRGPERAGARSFFTSRSTHQIPRDTGIGVLGGGDMSHRHPAIQGEKNLAQMAGQLEYSIDLPFRDVLLSQLPLRRPALDQKYEQARVEIQKDTSDKPDHTFSSSMARQLLHVPCERQDLFGKYPRVYSTYSRPLAETALQRNGTYNMHLGYMCMLRHFRGIADATLHNEGKSPVSLMSSYSTSKLKDAGLSITSAELMDSIEGPLRDTIDKEQERRRAAGNTVPAVLVTAPSGEPLDTQAFLDAHTRAFRATIDPDNLNNYKKSGKFLDDAAQAVKDLQFLVRGTHSALPEELSLRQDPSLGNKDQRHRWPTDVI